MRETLDHGGHVMQAHEVAALMRRVSLADFRLLGIDPEMAHPAWMVFEKYLPVAPPVIRPTESQVGDRANRLHMLTRKYHDVVVANNALHKVLTQDVALSSQVHMARATLQYAISWLIEDAVPASGRVNRRATNIAHASLLGDLHNHAEGEKTYMRLYMQGKRCDYTARTVITVDPNIDVDEIGVPHSVMIGLRPQYMVHERNAQQLTLRLVTQPLIEGAIPEDAPPSEDGTPPVGEGMWITEFRRGGVTASSSRSDGNDMMVVNKRTREFVAQKMLQPGDVVSRTLVTGDMVLMNRQPSLHKMSMMAHRARDMPYSSFRLNTSATTPYNADFDGDEMNLHVPCGVLPTVELQMLASVKYQMVNPRDQSGSIGVVQDGLLAAWIISCKDTFFTKETFFNLLMQFNDLDPQRALIGAFDVAHLPVPAVLKPQKLWTGKQLLSLLLPRGFNYAKRNADDSDDYWDSGDCELDWVGAKADLRSFPERPVRDILQNRTSGRFAGLGSARPPTPKT